MTYLPTVAALTAALTGAAAAGQPPLAQWQGEYTDRSTVALSEKYARPEEASRWLVTHGILSMIEPMKAR
jgi:hypothetical protein